MKVGIHQSCKQLSLKLVRVSSFLGLHEEKRRSGMPIRIMYDACIREARDEKRRLLGIVVK